MSNHHVTITVDSRLHATLGQCPPGILEIVVDALTYNRITHRLDGPHGIDDEISPRMFAQVCKRGGGLLFFPAGLMERVVERLGRDGIGAQIVDQRRRSSRLARAKQYLDELPARDRRRLRTMLANPLGQVEVTDVADAIDVVGQLARIWPRGRIDICAATRRAVIECRNRLAEQLSKDVRLAVSGRVRRIGRILVGTSHMLPRDDRRDILIVLDGGELWGLSAINRRWHGDAHYRRRFALVQRNRRNDSWRNFALQALTGPVISTGRRPRKQIARTYLLAEGKKPRRAGSRLTQKRERFWLNAARNKLVANMAVGLADNPDRALLEHMREHIVVGQLGTREDPRVAILVESAEHARELARLLPTWRIDTANEPARRNLTPNIESPHAIVTETRAAKFGVDAQIIIRAAGTSAPLKIRNFPPRTTREESGTHVLIVDVIDSLAERTTNSRSSKRRTTLIESR